MNLAKHYASIFILALVVSGCPSMPMQPDVAVFAAKQNYRTALVAAVAYKRLPLCGPTVTTKLCHTKEILTRVQKADDAAFALIEGAEKVAGTGGSAFTKALAAAEQSAQAFLSITATLEK